MDFYTWRDELTLDAPADGLDVIDLRTANGAITVRGANVETVQVIAARHVRAADEVAGRLCLAALKPDLQRDGDTLVVRVPYFEGERSPSVREARVDYTVTLPARFAVRAKTKNGAVRVAEVEQNVDVVTLNGEIGISDVGGNAEALTCNGQIALDRVGGVTKVETMNGAIHADVRDLPEQATLKTMNGAISLRVPPDAAFTLRAQTALGAIQTDWGEAHGWMGLASRYETPVNGGGAPVQLQTGNGAIRVMRGD